MDFQTSNRIYDELALTVGMRLSDLGQTLGESDVAFLATDVDRDAGVDRACALGRLALDSNDLGAVGKAVEAQEDRIRSIISMKAPGDPAFAVVQRRDLDEAKLRHRLLTGYLRNDRSDMLLAYQGIMGLHASRR